MWISITTTSGRTVLVSATASAPFLARPTTRISGSLSSMVERSSKVVALSSAIRTRIKISSQQLLDRLKELGLVERALYQVGIGSSLEAARAVLGAVAGREEDHGQVA